MSKSKQVTSFLPQVAANALRQLGENIAIARRRRGESRPAWAQRIGVSVPTLIRLEKGDPGVSMATYASALWLIGRVQVLGTLAAPENDMGALEAEVRKAQTRRRVSAAQSAVARTGKTKESSS